MTGIENIQETTDLVFRKPELEDGAEIHRLIKNSPPLDLNSLYCYLLICEHFNDTSIVALKGNSIAGFISAYMHPKNNETLFVWQVAVDSSMRKQGLAMKMLMAILGGNISRNIKNIETTVSPSNKASSLFFEKAAAELKTDLKKETFITESMFGSENHEEEILYRIGPFEI